MAARATDPIAQALLGWMQLNPALLRGFLADEAEGAADLSPAGDPAIRAHLRFVAAALADTAHGGLRPPLEAFSDGLKGDLTARLDAVDQELALVGEATAHELGLQFGDSAPDDPSLRAMVDRRLRIAAWHRVFLRALDEALGPERAAADSALLWMADRQTLLADTIFAMDKRAKQAEIARGGPDAVANPEVVNQIGQAAALQAHTRFLVEALAAT